MSVLVPVISQKTYPGVGDVDDCTVIATFWAARASGYAGALPTVTEFRAAAGVPDLPGPSGMTNLEVWRGVEGTSLARLRPMLQQGIAWGDFLSALRSGAAASVTLVSSYLPSVARFGFLGVHRVGVIWSGGRLLLANPLAAGGADPLAIDPETLRTAIQANRGAVYAVSFLPAEDSMSIYLRRDRAGRFTIPAGKVVRGYRAVAGSWAPDLSRPATPNATSGPFDHTLTRLSGDAVPEQLHHVTGGTFAGMYLDAKSVLEELLPLPDPDTKHTVTLSIDGQPVSTTEV